MPCAKSALHRLTRLQPPPCELLRIRWCRFTSVALTRPVLKPALEYVTNCSPSPPSWSLAMTDRELIDRLLFLAQTAVDQALDLNYDDPEDYFIYRELRELKAAALAQPEPQGPSRPAIEPVP